VPNIMRLDVRLVTASTVRTTPAITTRGFRQKRRLHTGHMEETFTAVAPDGVDTNRSRCEPLPWRIPEHMGQAANSLCTPIRAVSAEMNRVREFLNELLLAGDKFIAGA